MVQNNALLSRQPILIRQARVLTLDDQNRDLACADILIRDGRIAAIGKLPEGSISAGTDVRVIEAQGMLAMPGLINAHFHSPGNFLKGQLDGYPLEIFMLYEVPPLAATGDSDRYIYLRTLMGALEMLERGITTVHDDAYHVPIATPQSIDAVMRAYADSGMRATVAIDQPNVVEYDKFPYLRDILPDELRREMEDVPRQSDEALLTLYQYLLKHWHGANHGRLAAAVSCSAPQRVTPDYLQALGALSQAHKLPYNIHVLETKLQRATGQERFGKSLLRYVHDMGVLNEYSQIIHAIWIDDNDVRLLAKANAVVVHNPVCNLRLGSGVMPFRALRDAGITVAIGTDELCTDDTANVWLAGKMAGLIHNLSTPDYDRWPRHGEILQAMTRGGARAIQRMEDLGQISVGAQADIILLDLDTWAFTPCNDVARQLVYSEDGSSVRTTIVAGEVVIEQGRHVSLDSSAIRAEIRELTREIESQLTTSHTAAQRLMPHYRAMYDRAHAVPSGLQRRLVRSPD